MKEILKEWRKFLKEQEYVPLPDEAGSIRTTLTPEQQEEEYKKQQEQKFINDFYRAREEYWKKNSPQGQEAWNADPISRASAPLTSQQQQLFKLYDKLQSSKTEIDREYFIRQINNLQYGVNPLELWELFNSLGGIAVPNHPLRPTSSVKPSVRTIQPINVAKIPDIPKVKIVDKTYEYGKEPYQVYRTTSPIKLYHVNPKEDLKIEDVNMGGRIGKGSKRGSLIAGLYLTSAEAATKGRYSSGYGGNLYEITINPLNIIQSNKFGYFSRVSPEQLQNFVQNDIKGLIGDDSGVSQFVLLDKSAISSIKKVDSTNKL